MSIALTSFLAAKTAKGLQLQNGKTDELPNASARE